MPMTVGLKTANNVTPATGTFDFNSATQFDQPGPYWVAFIAWVETPDVLAGTLQLDHVHRDPAGNDQTLTTTTSPQLNLADPLSTVTTPVQMIQRLSGSSLWDFNTTLFGLAGVAKIAYRIMVFPLDPSEFSPF